YIYIYILKFSLASSVVCPLDLLVKGRRDVNGKSKMRFFSPSQ
ncbi:MAG: hypothetical protein ACI90V_002860, partial [Bacillariaceae sp.]